MYSLQMNVFVIFLFIVTGCASADQRGVRIGEDYLEDNENARKAVSHDVRKTNVQGQYIQSKDVHASDQNVAASSNKTETYEKRPQVVTPTTEGKTSAQKVYFRTRAMDKTRSFLRHFHRHIPEQRSSMEVKRSSPEASAAIRRLETYLAIKTRWLLRAKRSADRDAKRNKLAPFQAFQNMMEIRKNLPMKMMKRIYSTNAAEGLLLDSLAASNSASADLLNAYKAEKNLERQTLRETMAFDPENAGAIIKSYKMLIRDGAYDDYLYDHFKLREKHAAFFDTPSAALKEYRNLKRQEVESLDSFLQGSSQAGMYKAGSEGILNENAKNAKRSYTPQIRSQVFVIILCLVIEYASVTLDWEIGEDDLKANENARKSGSIDAKETVFSQDQCNREKDVHGSVQSVIASSSEAENCEGKKSEKGVSVGRRVVFRRSPLSRSQRHTAACGERRRKSRAVYLERIA